MPFGGLNALLETERVLGTKDAFGCRNTLLMSERALGGQNALLRPKSALEVESGFEDKLRSIRRNALGGLSCDSRNRSWLFKTDVILMVC